MKTREQQRAETVYQQIERVKTEAWGKDYGRICLSFPAVVYQCGLCQAVAFGLSKSAVKKDDDSRESGRKKAFRQFLSDLGTATGHTSLDQFTQKVRTAELSEYQFLTREVMALSNWYKRYAEAILKVEPGEQEG
jgi:CRISPR-associated protein Cmr5